MPKLQYTQINTKLQYTRKGWLSDTALRDWISQKRKKKAAMKVNHFASPTSALGIQSWVIWNQRPSDKIIFFRPSWNLAILGPNLAGLKVESDEIWNFFDGNTDNEDGIAAKPRKGRSGSDRLIGWQISLCFVHNYIQNSAYPCK